MKNLGWLFLLAGTFTGLVCEAAPPPEPKKSFTLNLDRAIGIALDKNPGLQEAREHVTETRATISFANAVLFPTVVGTAQSSFSKDAGMSPNAAFGGDSYNSYSFGLRATQPLFTWGIFSGIGLTKKDLEISRVNLEIAGRDLMNNVTQSFYKVLWSQRSLDTLLRLQSVQKEALATAQHRQRIGRGQLLDVLQVKTQLALLLPKIAQTRTQTELASAELVNRLGDPSIQEIRVEGSLDVDPLTEVQKKLNLKNYDLPEYKRLMLTEERLRAERDVTLGQNYPQINAFGNWGRSANRKSDLLDGASTAWSVGLTLTVPIFSGLSSFDQRRTYSSRLAQLELEEANLQNQLSLNQISAYKNLELAQDNLSSSESAFELAEASFKEAKRNFQYATIDFVQYLSVQQADLEASSSLDLSKYTYITSLVNYFIASGLPLNQLVKLLTEHTE